jgi:hypothetical protein
VDRTLTPRLACRSAATPDHGCASRRARYILGSGTGHLAQAGCRPGRLIELHQVDLPVRPHLLQNRNVSVVGPPTGSRATVVLLSGYDKGR